MNELFPTPGGPLIPIRIPQSDKIEDDEYDESEALSFDLVWRTVGEEDDVNNISFIRLCANIRS